ncbi:PTS lactose/cellobiose transporter subunit IIA [Companilactobacillus crustorum]|uniref:PTS lactose/cellobiose transporter subunit IIA n=1 Tax=Companilactobacillus crustorum TaxID=392416 RepID=UPI00095795A7|nr:PTS lactose/cellobiose transporter subunit IIA [Companilactobacillus crustorum]APU72373.1 hypothetical protein BI355_2079 [Companilactobacillus crustorum]HCD07208.1 PTS lactose/cellobiose transporter subunit IIA [Lactobacillus sp.]
MINEDENTAVTRNTMNIIIYAGDARTLIMQAMDLLGDFNYEEAESLIKQAHEKLVAAHQLQTDRIQEEAEGKTVQYTILFSHAQDTLMTINTEYNLVSHLIKVFKKRDVEYGNGQK